MKKRQNLFLAILVMLFSFYAVWDYLQSENEAIIKSERSLLLPLKTDQVKEVEIIKPDSKLKLQKDVQGWQIIEPFQDWADNEFVEDFVAAATADKELSTIESHDSSQFGLSQPIAKFVFTNNQGVKKTLILSAKQNFEGSHYAQRENEKQVLLVTNVWATRAKKSLSEYRDRKLLRHKVASVQSFTVRNPKGQFELKNIDGKWISSTKPDWDLDQNLIRQLLQSLVEAKADDFISENNIQPAELNKYLLLNPDLSLELQLSEVKWSGQLGKVKDKHRYFYAQGQKSFIYQVSDSSLARLQNVQLFELRDAQVFFQFDKKRVAQIIYQGKLKKWKIEKNKEEWEFKLQDKQIQVAKAPQLIESILFSHVGQFLNKNVKSLPLNHLLEMTDSNGQVIWSIKWSDEIEPSLIEGNKKYRLAQTSLSNEVFALDEATINAWGFEDLLESEKKQPHN